MATQKKKPEPGVKPEFQVVEDKLYCQSDAGEIVLLLDIPFKYLRKIRGAEANDDELEQMMTILSLLGDKQAIERLESLGTFKVMRIVARYFSEFGKLQESAMGEFSGSQNS